MALATVYSRARQGLDAPPVSVEVHLANGLPGFSLVGLPAAAVRESKDRVRAAIVNCGFSFPTRRITVSLAPADLPKDGGRFDLPIAIGILAAAGEIDKTLLDRTEFLGELSLSGKLRPILGALPAVLAAGEIGRELILPEANAEEAGLAAVEGGFAADDLLAVCSHLADREKLPEIPATSLPVSPREIPDIRDVRGQKQAKRALEIAAAGQHHLLFVGPPGSGKSMLAARVPGVLPPMAQEECIEVAAIQSVSKSGLDFTRWGRRPFRAPHHSSSGTALVGGGTLPNPGEITLAHRGVLFMDELPEFNRQALEALREPLESGEITISRAAGRAVYPAKFQLIAAMNPCPCGWWGESSGRCQCTLEQIQRYSNRISGPLLNRIDMQIYVRPVTTEQLRLGAKEEAREESVMVQQRVIKAYNRQLQRQGKANAHIEVAELGRLLNMTTDAQALIDRTMRQMQWSARAYHRVLRVARTIADLAAAEAVQAVHISEALQYRQLDRQASP